MGLPLVSLAAGGSNFRRAQDHAVTVKGSSATAASEDGKEANSRRSARAVLLASAGTPMPSTTPVILEEDGCPPDHHPRGEGDPPAPVRTMEPMEPVAGRPSASPVPVQPEATATATPDCVPDATPDPNVTPGPTSTPDPNATPGPNPTPDPNATPGPHPTPDPNATPGPNPTPDPNATPGPNPTPDPNATPGPNPTPGPEVTPEPGETPLPEATPEPGSTPEPGDDDDDDGPISLGGKPRINFRVVKAGDELKLGSGLSGTVGGQMRVQLSIMLMPNCRVNPNARTVTVRLKEEPDGANSVEHPEKENHVDVTFGLDGWWLKWRAAVVPGSQTPPPPVLIGAGNPKDPNMDPNNAYIYTATFAWNSAGINGYDTIFGYYWDWENWDEGYWNEGYWAYWMWGYYGWGNGWSTGDSQLLGHNGEHTLSMVKVGYANGGAVQEQETDDFPFQTFNPFGGAWSDVAVSPGEKQFDVQNVVITEAKSENVIGDGNLDYFKFDPDSDDSALTNPKLSFTIKDEGDPHRYRWYLWVKPTRGEFNSVAVTGIMAKPGTQTVTINKAVAGSTQNEQLKEWGTYTFNLRIIEIQKNSEAEVGEPWLELRSEKMEMPYSYLDSEGKSKPGHSFDVEVNDDDGEMKAVVSYFLKSERDASEGKITFLDASMKEAENISMELGSNVAREEIDLHTFDGKEKVSETQQDSTYRAIFTATDSYFDQYRDHQNKRIAVANIRKKFKSFHIEDDWMQMANIIHSPQAQSLKLRHAFAPAKWQVLTRTVSPTQVGKEFCKSVLSRGFSGVNDPSLTQFSRDTFHYYNSRNSPAAVTGHKYGRYIHVIGAGSIPSESDNFKIFGLTSPRYASGSERWSYTFEGEIKGYSPNGVIILSDQDVQNITIHEVGHQFLPSGHGHGYVTPKAESTQREKAAYDEALDPNNSTALIRLRTFRARLKNATNLPLDRDSYFKCVMEPFYDKENNDWQFCKYHRDLASEYDFGD